ncbi:MAG: septal ring lytic transglycosylase RlpA family protein [Rhodospirillaceae bacterium]|nr:septal ring lytic transglycosylase RlpA family protein [Rhodospirillaceae bacterium]MBT5664522.1 septal ring lytic transglycosylase RlpA family protein [Rhodospirillaceae bacterium]MBT5810184.1 septal ring lytic transglycosylase RlpA family protein [Rhodospirillaceae bacterium]
MTLLAGVLSGCAETRLFIHGAKRITGSATPEGPMRGGRYKVGKPYQIGKVWYYPKSDYAYAETGIGSWYGPQFDGKDTANGETFDMNSVSAAHRTLPLPSIVRVVNLDNGRALNVRVNDRGPFARGRIIDLSRRAAQLLGFEKQGTAKVRVEILARESQQLASAYGVSGLKETKPHPVPNAAPTSRVASVKLAAPEGFKTAAPDKNSEPSEFGKSAGVPSHPKIVELKLDETVSVVPVPASSGIFVQAGAFARYENANRLRALLSSVGDARIYQVTVSKQPFFRVRLGPATTVDEADKMLAKLVASGYDKARIIVD